MHRLAQSRDLVPDHQLAALQLCDFKSIYGGMGKGFVQLVFENPMLAFQLHKMRLNAHRQSLLD